MLVCSYMCVCVCVCVCACACAYVGACVHVCMYVRMCVCTYVCMRACVFLITSTYMTLNGNDMSSTYCVCSIFAPQSTFYYICSYAYISYIYIYIYIYTSFQILLLQIDCASVQNKQAEHWSKSEDFDLVIASCFLSVHVVKLIPWNY